MKATALVCAALLCGKSDVNRFWLKYKALSATAPSVLHQKNTCIQTMGLNSKTSRALADVRLQLKTRKTRGRNPRPLLSDEVQALELKRVQLQEEMAMARHERSAVRINNCTTREAALESPPVDVEAAVGGIRTAPGARDRSRSPPQGLAPSSDLVVSTSYDESLTFADHLAVVHDSIADPTACLYVTKKLSAEHHKLQFLGNSHSIIQLHQTAEALQLEYKEACVSAQKGISQLQRASVEVQRQIRVANEERIGNVYHKGYQAAVTAFMKMSWELRRHDFICHGWIRECHMRAGLDPIKWTQARPLPNAIAADVMLFGHLNWRDIPGSNLLV